MERRPAPPPLETDDRLTLLVSMAAWLIALVVLALMHRTLSQHHEIWWLWTCGLGFVMGFYGLWFVGPHRGSSRPG